VFDEKSIIEKGISCFKTREYANALNIFNEVIESGTKSAEPYFYLGNIFHMKGEVGKAIKAFNKVLELEPNHTDAAISLSILYNDIGKYEEGKRIFEKTNQRVKASAQSSAPEDQHINKKFSFKHYELADLYLSYNRFDEALFEYNKAASLDPSNLEIRIKLAKVYAKKGFVHKAFDELKRLKNESPTFLPARIALGVLYYANGNIIEAQSEWEKVLSKDPTNSEAGMYMNISKTATETSV
jgi:tetratricopeptide (TPR) repeat protein